MKQLYTRYMLVFSEFNLDGEIVPYDLYLNMIRLATEPVTAVEIHHTLIEEVQNVIESL